MAVRFTLNGKATSFDGDADMPLLWYLRDHARLTGTKFGCGIAACGACTVHVDGDALRSCVTPAAAVGNARITTIEGIADDPVGRRVQAAWTELDVAQCGYCQPGQIMTATALLKRTPKPSDAEIDAAMNGNLCRCATYLRIRQAIKRASGQKEA